MTLQHVKLGFYTIDLKLQFVYQTNDPANTEEQFEFEEVWTQKRDFRSDTSRFAVNFATESLLHGNKGVACKLGYDWAKKYCGIKDPSWNDYRDFFPSVNQILSGLKAQEKVELEMTSGFINTSSDEFNQAYETKC